MLELFLVSLIPILDFKWADIKWIYVRAYSAQMMKIYGDKESPCWNASFQIKGATCYTSNNNLNFAKI